MNRIRAHDLCAITELSTGTGDQLGPQSDQLPACLSCVYTLSLFISMQIKGVKLSTYFWRGNLPCVALIASSPNSSLSRSSD